MAAGCLGIRFPLLSIQTPSIFWGIIYLTPKRQYNPLAIRAAQFEEGLNSIRDQLLMEAT